MERKQRGRGGRTTPEGGGEGKPAWCFSDAGGSSGGGVSLVLCTMFFLYFLLR
jgi:hypothetical protein